MLALVREALRTRWFERKWLRGNHNGQTAEKGDPSVENESLSTLVLFVLSSCSFKEPGQQDEQDDG